MTKREKYLEGLIAQLFLDEEGQYRCLQADGLCDECEIKDLCDEAEKIIEKESVAK